MYHHITDFKYPCSIFINWQLGGFLAISAAVTRWVTSWATATMSRDYWNILAPFYGANITWRVSLCGMWLYEICTSYKHPGDINTVHGEDYSVTVTDLVSVTAHKGGAGIHRAFGAALNVPMMEDLHSWGEVLSHTPRVRVSSANSQSSLNHAFSCHSFRSSPAMGNYILKWTKSFLRCLKFPFIKF